MFSSTCHSRAGEGGEGEGGEGGKEGGEEGGEGRRKGAGRGGEKKGSREGREGGCGTWDLTDNCGCTTSASLDSKHTHTVYAYHVSCELKLNHVHTSPKITVRMDMRGCACTAYHCVHVHQYGTMYRPQLNRACKSVPTVCSQ